VSLCFFKAASVLERRRVDIAVGVFYAEDLEKEDVVLSAI
jgi:hypothetical protein